MQLREALWLQMHSFKNWPEILLLPRDRPVIPKEMFILRINRTTGFSNGALTISVPHYFSPAAGEMVLVSRKKVICGPVLTRRIRFGASRWTKKLLWC